MSEIGATEASRRFADLLDAVEHAGEEYTIVRRGRAIAQIGPVVRGRGADVKAALRTVAPDPDWADDLAAVRGVIDLEERP